MTGIQRLNRRGIPWFILYLLTSEPIPTLHHNSTPKAELQLFGLFWWFFKNALSAVPCEAREACAWRREQHSSLKSLRRLLACVPAAVLGGDFNMPISVPGTAQRALLEQY
jgi:hypothetical protein